MPRFLSSSVEEEALTRTLSERERAHSNREGVTELSLLSEKLSYFPESYDDDGAGRIRPTQADGRLWLSEHCFYYIMYCCTS